jgi:23S rRNA (cytosine1962-C5)-methyltransferase
VPHLAEVAIIPVVESKADDYELLDAGDGRRLERFGELVVDRPAPGALGPRRDPGAWERADLVFERHAGWRGRAVDRGPWRAGLGGVTFELRPTETGQVGVFPEQRDVWRWVAANVLRHREPALLNLFAYTGGATLVAAVAGASVAHVDASRPAIAWARRNAELSRLAERPIRWLVDDAEAFLRREARRGRRYDGIVLDPPSYGHGPDGRAWRLEERLEPLLALCAAVAAPGAFVAVSHHTPAIDAAALSSALAGALDRRLDDIEAGVLAIDAANGTRLRLADWARTRGRP